MFFSKTKTVKKDGVELKIVLNYSSIGHKIQNFVLESILYLIIVSPVIFVCIHLSIFSFPVIFFVLSLVVLVLTAGYFFWAGFINPKNTLIKEYTIHHKKIKESVKIVFVADIGAGSSSFSMKHKDVARMVKAINRLKPDIVLIGGDLIDFYEADIPQLEPLKDICSRSGVYGVLGNHDYAHMSFQIHEAKTPWKFITYLRKLGVTILGNDGKEISIRNEKLYLGGIWDIETLKFNHKEALANRSGKPYTILLGHNPDIVEWIKKEDDIDLVLSGHLHHGQVRLPLIGPLSLPNTIVGKKLLYGLYQLNKCKLIITSGIGRSGSRLRIGTHSEIVEITLKGE